MFGSKIREYRTKNKMTQKSLASLVGISQTMVSKIEKGMRVPTDESLRNFSSVLGIPLDDLTTESSYERGVLVDVIKKLPYQLLKDVTSYINYLKYRGKK